MVRRGMAVSCVHGSVEAFYAPHAGEGNQILQNNTGSARLLPFCEAANDKLLSCLAAVLVRYAAGARAYRIISCKGCESFENPWGSACV
jgi:hypothetical protein